MDQSLNLSMFRAYDIRTPAHLLTSALAQRLAAAEAKYFCEVLEVSSVIVAHDARRTGPQYLTIAADAFRDAGLDVIYLPGPVSTSHLYFAAMRFPASMPPVNDTIRTRSSLTNGSPIRLPWPVIN